MGQIGRMTITSSQWICRNVSYHGKQGGYNKRKRNEELNHNTVHLSKIAPRNFSQENRFLLESDKHDLAKESLQKNEYFDETMEVAINVGRRKAKMGRSANFVRRGMKRIVTRKEHLGVFEVDREVREDMATIGELLFQGFSRMK